MLEEAHHLRAVGRDVVLGFIETHGRVETAALVEGLETIPLREVAYRGFTVKEMDLEAILAREPQPHRQTTYRSNGERNRPGLLPRPGRRSSRRRRFCRGTSRASPRRQDLSHGAGHSGIAEFFPTQQPVALARAVFA